MHAPVPFPISHRLVTTLGLALLVFSTLAHHARAEEGPLRAGAAVVDITPPEGVPMAGYYHGRSARGVHDPLFSRAIVIESGKRRATIVALDLITTTRDLVDRTREAIEEKTGIPGDHVMISATHAHTGPVLRDLSSRTKALGGASEAAVEYSRTLPDHITRSVALALERAVDARALSAVGQETTLAFNRRFHMRDGSIGWNPRKLDPAIRRPSGPIDPDVPVVAFEGPGGKRLATYVNFAMHLDTVGGLQISADFPYTLSRCLAGIHGESTVTVFTIGCAGDINHRNVHWDSGQKGHSEAARIGTVLAGAVVETMPRLRPVEPGPLLARKQIVKLDLAPITDADVEKARQTLEKGTDDRAVPFLEIVKAYQTLDVHRRAGKPIEGEVQVISLGRDLAWVGLPGEIFVELGIALKHASPFRHTIIAELAGGSVGYVPTRQAYTQGNYEVITARVAAGSGERLVEAASGMLLDLFRQAVKEAGDGS